MKSGALGLFVALLCATASAQGLAPNGFAVGNGRLHLLGEVDSRFDSLVGYFDRQGVPSPEFVFIPRLGLGYQLESASTQVRFDANAQYMIFSGILSPSSRALSRIQARATLDTAFNRDGPVGVDIGDTFARSDQTQNAAAGIGVISLQNALYLAVPIRPGGRAIELTPRVTWGVEFFEPLLTGVTTCPPGDSSCDPALVSNMNYSNLNFALAARWKFLPKTTALFDTSFDYRTYWNPAATNLPAQILRSRLGVTGLVTPRFAATLMAGAAYDFAATQRVAPVGQAEVTYLAGDAVSVSLGYLRDLMPVPVFGTFANDRGYLDAQFSLMGERLLLNARASIDYFTFFAQMGGVSGRNDLQIGATGGASFVVVPWFLVGASYAVGTRSSTQSTQTGINFVRHEANLRLTFRY